MVRPTVISDELWAHLERALALEVGRRGRPWNDHRRTLEGIFWHFRTTTPWRDLPPEFGAWQSVWERHHRWSTDGTYERMLTAVRESLASGDSAALISGIDAVASMGLFMAPDRRKPLRGRRERRVEP